MFNINQTPTYYWPVKLKLPDEAGVLREQQFDAKFQRHTQDQIDGLKKEALEGAEDSAIARKLLVGWKGVTNGSDEFSYSAENRDVLLGIAGVASAVVLAFLDSLPGARRGNS